MIKFGASPIAWSNDDLPELGGETSLETCLQDLMDLGYDGVELGNKFPRDADKLDAAVAPFGIQIIGGWFSGHLLEQDVQLEIAAMQSHLALLRAMGTDVFVYAEVSRAIHGQRATPLDETPRLNDAEWALFTRRMQEIGDYLAGEGFRLAYHHHMGTVVETAGDLARFLAGTNSRVGLVLDTGHATMGGIDPLAVIKSHPDRIVHVHCKDIRGAIVDQVRANGSSFLDGVIDGMFTVPGDGDLAFGPVMKALAEIGYSGWIVVEAEQDPAKADPREYAGIGIAELRRHASAAGLV